MLLPSTFLIFVVRKTPPSTSSATTVMRSLAVLRLCQDSLPVHLALLAQTLDNVRQVREVPHCRATVGTVLREATATTTTRKGRQSESGPVSRRRGTHPGLVQESEVAHHLRSSSKEMSSAQRFTYD